MNASRARAVDHSRVPFPRARVTASLRALGQSSRARTRTAATTLIDCLDRFVAAGQVPLAAALGDTDAPQVWHQYGTVGDMPADGGVGALHFYYHAHRTPGASSAEHGHFHLFAPLGATGGDAPRYTHLLAIGVDARGMPLRLFTTNRWVTDETWLPAERVIALIEAVAASPATGAIRWRPGCARSSVSSRRRSRPCCGIAIDAWPHACRAGVGRACWKTAACTCSAIAVSRSNANWWRSTMSVTERSNRTGWRE